MAVILSRAAFISGKFSAEEAEQTVLRPPWAVDDGVFAEACDSCGKCIPACPERILISGRGALPEVDFNRGECTFCGKCAAACPTGALSRNDPDDATQSVAPWSITARFSGACLSAKGISCRICGDQCDRQAISFKLAVGGIAMPVMDSLQCTGCGACFAACPTNAIEFN